MAGKCSGGKTQDRVRFALAGNCSGGKFKSACSSRWRESVVAGKVKSILRFALAGNYSGGETLLVCSCLLTPNVLSTPGFLENLWASYVQRKNQCPKLSRSFCYISSVMDQIPRESLESLLMPGLLKKSSWNWMKVSEGFGVITCVLWLIHVSQAVSDQCYNIERRMGTRISASGDLHQVIMSDIVEKPTL